MPKFFSLLAVTLLLISLVSNSEATETNEKASSLNLEDNYASYITPTNYPKIVLNDDYGLLVSANKIVEYIQPQLYSFYRQQVCDGVYWFNCKHNIQSLTLNTGVDLNKPQSLISGRFEQIKGYQVVYTTEGVNQEPYNVSGAILVPNSQTPLKGIVIYYHETSLSTKDVPSNFRGDKYQIAKLMASTLASAGYVVILPDYIGLGGDKDSISPYMVYPWFNALSGIYMLKLLPQAVPALRFQLQNRHVRLFVTGYGDGAQYALWSAKILQENNSFLDRYGFVLRQVVGLDGGYNLSKVTIPFLFSNITKDDAPPYFVSSTKLSAYNKPITLSMLLNSFQYYSIKSQKLNAFSDQYISALQSKADKFGYSISNLFKENTDEKQISQILNNAAQKAGYSNSNSVAPLVNQAVLSTYYFEKVISGADIYNWQSTTPINLVSLENDSIVPRLNSEVAFTAMTNKKSSQMELTIVPNKNFVVKGSNLFSDSAIDHDSGLKFLILFARKSFESNINLN